MNKYIVIAFAIALSFRPVQAQNYAISFEGTGASDVVDSVKVENITQGTSFTVAGKDILSLSRAFPTKINSLVSGGIKSLLIYPNPSAYTTYLEFTPSCPGESVIAVYDMSGKLIFRELADLDDSPQRFMISGVRKGMYLIKVTGRTYRYSGKLISINPDFGSIKIERLSPFAFRKEDNKEKASNVHKGSHADPETSYNYGDRLKFTGNSGVYTTIAFGEPVSDTTITFDFIPCTDGDNNNYQVVKIGTQIWMAENLRTTRFNDGAEIPNIKDEYLWRTAATPAYRFYNNQSDHIKTYGAIYNWQAASSGKICPTGWHVPDTSEISILTGYLENQSEFTFDPGDWWLTTEIDLTNAFYWSFKHNLSKEYVYQADKQNGHYVKCIKDSELDDTAMWSSFCPPRLIITVPTFIDEMEAAEEWAVTNGTIELNVTEVKSGEASLKLISNLAATTGTRIAKTIPVVLTEDMVKKMRVWHYFPEGDPVTQITVFLATDAAFANSYSKSFGISANELDFAKWSVIGAKNWSVLQGNPNFNDLRYIRIQPIRPQNNTCIYSLDKLSFGGSIKPSILIFFDDGNDSDYLKAYPILKANHMVATSYIIKNSIGNAGRLSEAQLIELNNNKWDIANHTETHNYLTPPETEAGYIAEMEACRVFLDGLGLTRASKHFGYTGSSYGAVSLAAVKAWGAKTAKLGGTGYLDYDSYMWPHSIHAYFPAVDTSVDTLKSWIESSLSYGSIPAIGFHRLVDANAQQYQWLVSQFSEIVTHIKTLGLQTLTIDEFYRIYSGGITVHHK